MSLTHRDGTKFVPAHRGPEIFWDAVEEVFSPNEERHWRYLAMLALREDCGWPIERIGRAFGHNKGHITRCLERIKSEVRSRLSPEEFCSRPTDRTPPPNPDDFPQ